MNVGLVDQGGTATATASVANTAPVDATYTETLSSNGLTGTTAGFTATGSFSGITAGGAAGTITVGLGSSLSAGAESGTTTLALNSNEVNSSGLGTTALAAQTITITGNVYSGQSHWATNGSGSWGTIAGSRAGAFGTNWGTNQGSPGLDAGFTSTDTATFNSALTSTNATVTLDGASPSLNAITFDNVSHQYTVAQGSGGTLTMDNTLGNNTLAGTDATITVANGIHAISAPIALNSNLSVAATNGVDQLTLSGAVSGTGKALTVTAGNAVRLSCPAPTPTTAARRSRAAWCWSTTPRDRDRHRHGPRRRHQRKQRLPCYAGRHRNDLRSGRHPCRQHHLRG